MWAMDYYFDRRSTKHQQVSVAVVGPIRKKVDFNYSGNTIDVKKKWVFEFHLFWSYNIVSCT